MRQILCMEQVSWDREDWDNLKLNLQLNDNLAPTEHFRGCECGVSAFNFREGTLLGELTVEYMKSATIRNIFVFVLLLQIKDPMIGFAVKS